jgi:hypothetical protein
MQHNGSKIVAFRNHWVAAPPVPPQHALRSRGGKFSTRADNGRDVVHNQFTGDVWPEAVVLILTKDCGLDFCM